MGAAEAMGAEEAGVIDRFVARPLSDCRVPQRVEDAGQRLERLAPPALSEAQYKRQAAQRLGVCVFRSSSCHLASQPLLGE